MAYWEICSTKKKNEMFSDVYFFFTFLGVYGRGGDELVVVVTAL